MKNTLLLILLFVFGSFSVLAERISEDQARALAVSFFSSPQGTRKMAPARTGDNTLQLRKVSSGYYAFSRGTSSGYVIVAADTRAASEVLGYADSGSFIPETMPASMKAWLEEYDRQMAYAATLPEHVLRKEKAKMDPIAPLVTARWNQGAPYNELCPEMNGSRCVTGCVATAMAQIMYYHKWPVSGTGTRSYEWMQGGVSQGTLSADFSQSVYDWEAMTDTYGTSSDQRSRTAVAKLMADVGIASEMNYGVSESGAQSNRAGLSLVEHFDYDKSLSRYYRNYYTAEEWEKIIYDNLKDSQPLYYDGGASAGGAHAFVCDGYNDGYFHFNWGWGGTSDGYFLLSALDPYEQGIGGNGSGFNYNQGIFSGIRKNAGTSSHEKFMYCMDNFDVEQKESGHSQTATFTGWFSNQSLETINMTPGIKVVNPQNRVTYIPVSWSAQLASSYGYTRFDLALSSFPIASGVYRVYPAWRDNTNNRWYEMRTNIASSKRYLLATVQSGGVINFANPTDDVVIEARNLAAEGKIYAAKEFAATADFVSLSGEYLNDIRIAVTQPGSDEVLTTSSGVLLNLPEGETSSLRFVVPSPESSGSYDLVAVDASGKIVSERKEITVVRVPSSTLSLRIPRAPRMENKDCAVADDIRFSVDINCTGGFYSGRVYAYVFPQGGGKSLCSFSAPMIAGSGESRTLDFSGSFAGAEVGKTYMIYIYYVKDGNLEMVSALNNNNRIYFTIGSLTPVSSVVADVPAAFTEVYTPAGRKIAVLEGAEPDLSPLSSGVYILRTAGKTRRVLKR